MSARTAKRPLVFGVWIVEMKCDELWEPTVGIGLTREDGRKALVSWQLHNPDDKFRLRQYLGMDGAS
jgi:hypothetical protein